MEKIIEQLSLQLAGNKLNPKVEQKEFECQICGKRYKKMAYLSRHQNNHGNKQVSTKKKKDTVPDETVEKEATKEGNITSNTPSTQTLDSDTPVKCGDPGLLPSTMTHTTTSAAVTTTATMGFDSSSSSCSSGSPLPPITFNADKKTTLANRYSFPKKIQRKEKHLKSRHHMDMDMDYFVCDLSLF